MINMVHGPAVLLGRIRFISASSGTSGGTLSDVLQFSPPSFWKRTRHPNAAPHTSQGPPPSCSAVHGLEESGSEGEAEVKPRIVGSLRNERERDG